MDPPNGTPATGSVDEGSSSSLERQTLPSYEEAIKSLAAEPTEAPPPSYDEAVGSSRPAFVSAYSNRPPVGELARTRPVYRTNSDMIIVQLLSGLASDRPPSSSNVRRSRPASLLSTEHVGASQPPEYSRSLAKRVQMCFVFIVVAVIIVAGAITTSVIKSTNTDALSPVEIPTVNIPTDNAVSFHVPNPTHSIHSDWQLFLRHNSSKSTTNRSDWSYYIDKWKDYLKITAKDKNVTRELPGVI